MKKRGFTLIELLAVIILLAIIALVATPIILNVVSDSRNSVGLSEARTIYGGINSYCSTSKMQNQLTGKEDICADGVTKEEVKEMVNLGNAEVLNIKYKDGKVIRLVVKTNEKIYVLQSDGTFKIVDEYEPADPEVALKISDGLVNENGWINKNFYVNVNGKNITKYNYCVSNETCTPSTIVERTNGTIYVSTNGNNFICVQGYNEVEESEIICEEYKLDKVAPTFAKAIYYDKGGDINDYMNITFGPSGGTYSCDKNVSDFTADETNISNCTAISESGRTTNQEVSFVVNKLVKNSKHSINYPMTWNFLNLSISKEKIKSIHMVDNKNVPQGFTSKDVSLAQNGSIMAWYGKPDENGLYDLYIGQNGGVVASSGASLFHHLTNASVIDIEKLDTSAVIDMSYMFADTIDEDLDVSNLNTTNVINMSYMFGNANITNLDLSNFDTSNVTDMSGMFTGVTRYLKLGGPKNIMFGDKFVTDKVLNMSEMFYYNRATDLNLSNFDTKNVTNMSRMFSDSQATTLDLSGFDTSKVTNMTYMFANVKDKELNLSNFNTSNVTNMSWMFWNNKSTNLDLKNFDTSNTIGMSYMFYYSQATTLDLSGFDTSKVTSMQGMFDHSQAIILDLSNFNTKNVTNMARMFSGSQATSLDLSSFDTSVVTDMSSMFSGSRATSLDLSSFDTSVVTDMSAMFSGSRATSLDLGSFDTSNVTDMHYMFNNSQFLELDLGNFNTSKVENMWGMFEKSKATSIYLKSFDTSHVTSMQLMFSDGNVISLDLSSFDTSNVTNMEGMFKSSKAKEGYAKTQADADKFNASSYKPSALTFIVKPTE